MDASTGVLSLAAWLDYDEGVRVCEGGGGVCGGVEGVWGCGGGGGGGGDKNGGVPTLNCVFI